MVSDNLIQAMNDFREVFSSYCETVKEIIHRIKEYFYTKSKEEKRTYPLTPRDTTRKSQVLNRKPIMARVRSNL